MVETKTRDIPDMVWMINDRERRTGADGSILIESVAQVGA